VRNYKIIIAILVLAIGITEAIAGARCYRVFDCDLSDTTLTDTMAVEITAWNGSGEVAFFMNVTGYVKKLGVGATAGQVKCYSEIQDSMWVLRLNYESSAADVIAIADGYKRCAAGMYGGIAANTIVGNKAYGNKLHFYYIANDDSLGHLTLDVCVEKD